MSSKRQYLKRLPAEAQTLGDNENGEVEIVTGRKEAKKIARECADELSGSALGKSGKKTGILLEDEVHMFVRDPLRYPSGATNCRMRVIGKTEFDGPNGVAVLAMAEGRFVLREIYRHATRSWELEITRGRRESGQTPRQAVRAEVKQELGYAVKKVHHLGAIRPDSAIFSARLEMYFVELGAKGDPEPEDTEAFGQMVHLTPEELSDRILDGTIVDSYTMGAFLLAALKGLIPVDRSIASLTRSRDHAETGGSETEEQEEKGVGSNEPPVVSPNKPETMPGFDTDPSLIREVSA